MAPDPIGLPPPHRTCARRSVRRQRAPCWAPAATGVTAMDLLDLDHTLARLTLATPPDGMAALEATLGEAGWPLVQRLWRLGLTDIGIYRLLCLRARYC